MKILFASDTYYPHVNGTAIFVYRLAQLMAQEGHEVYVIAPSTTLFHRRDVHEPGVSVFGIPAMPFFNYPYFRFPIAVFSKKKIEKFIEEVSPDIIHLQQHFVIGKEVRKIARKMNIPTIGTNHFLPENLIPMFPLPKMFHGQIKKIGWNQMLGVYGDLPVVTTPTETAAKVIEEIGFTSSVIPVSNGIDLSRFSPKNKGEYLRKRYNLKKRKTVLFVGRLDKEKRLDLTIKAIALISKKVDVQLLAVGVGSQKAKLEALVGRLKLEDRVIFTDFMPDEDLSNVFSLGDVFAMPSTAELQGIAVMEAMASGLPVVAADYKALPELVHHGENGYLVHDSYLDLAKYLTKILQDPKLAAKMSKTSLKIIREHTVEKTVETYSMLYERVIGIYKEKPAAAFSGSRRRFWVGSFAAVSMAMVLIVSAALGNPPSIHAGKITFKVNAKILAERGVKQIKNGFYKVESTLIENIR